jgi:murein DD-endopeptidase MepM/ murein hydrolase activator NlpD
VGEYLNRRVAIVSLVVLAAGVAALEYFVRSTFVSDAPSQQPAQVAQAEAALAPEPATSTAPSETRILRGEHFMSALEKFGLSAEDAANASAAAQRAFNLRQVRAGNTITLNRSAEGALREIDYKIDPGRVLKIIPDDRGFSAEVQDIPSKTEVVTVAGRVDDSLFNAVEQAGESAELAMHLAQIFAYDLDFYTDPRKGDTFRVVLEKKKYSDGEIAGYGNILAAEYDNGGKKYQALLFHDEFGHPGYYTADGKSLQKAFLRSPLKFGAPVTSHFSKARFHPILKIYRPHMGTDYGAPVGTPVQTIGSGRVVFAGRKGGEGQHGADRALRGLRDDVFAFVAHVRAQRPTRGNRQNHRTGRQHRTFHRAASRFPYFATRAIQEFREARLAGFRSRRQEKLGRVRRCARQVLAAAARCGTGSSQRGSASDFRFPLTYASFPQRCENRDCFGFFPLGSLPHEKAPYILRLGG